MTSIDCQMGWPYEGMTLMEIMIRERGNGFICLLPVHTMMAVFQPPPGVSCSDYASYLEYLDKEDRSLDEDSGPKPSETEGEGDQAGDKEAHLPVSGTTAPPFPLEAKKRSREESAVGEFGDGVESETGSSSLPHKRVHSDHSDSADSEVAPDKHHAGPVQALPPTECGAGTPVPVPGSATVGEVAASCSSPSPHPVPAVERDEMKPLPGFDPLNTSPFQDLMSKFWKLTLKDMRDENKSIFTCDISPLFEPVPKDMFLNFPEDIREFISRYTSQACKGSGKSGGDTKSSKLSDCDITALIEQNKPIIIEGLKRMNATNVEGLERHQLAVMKSGVA